VQHELLPMLQDRYNLAHVRIFMSLTACSDTHPKCVWLVVRRVGSVTMMNE
jgi:hypothetical protein